MKANTITVAVSLLLAVTCAGISKAQFHDSPEKLDSAAISGFIDSYRARGEVLFAHTIQGSRFGPIRSFTDPNFVADDASTLPASSARSLVTVNNSAMLGLGVGTLLGTLISLGLYIDAVRKVDNINGVTPISSQRILLMYVFPFAGAALGAIVGLVIRHEDNAAPMNAFRAH